MSRYFAGAVDSADRGLVTIVVDPIFLPRLSEGDRVRVEYDEDPHVCDWRFYGRRADGLADVICAADGHDVNTRMRVCPKVVDTRQLPKYDGQFDV